MASSVLDYIDKFEDRQKKKVVSEKKKVKRKVVRERKAAPPIPKALRERRVVKKTVEPKGQPVHEETKSANVYERTMNHATDILDGLPEQQPQVLEFEDPVLAEQMMGQPKPIAPTKVPDEIKSPEDMSNYASALL